MKLIYLSISSIVLFYFSLIFVYSPIFAIMLLGLTLFCVFFWFFPKISLFFFLLFMLLQGVIVHLTKLGIINSLDELGILSIAFLLIVKKLILRRPFYKSTIALPLILVVTIGLISTTVYKIVPYAIAWGGVLLFFKGFIIYYIFLNMDFNENDIRIFLKWLYRIGIGTFIYGVFGVIWPNIFLVPIGASCSGRAGLTALQSFLGHPGSFSAFMGILFCFSFADGLFEKKSSQYFLPVIFLIGIILSLRRTTLLGVFLACIFIISSKRIRKIIGTKFSIKPLLVVLSVCIIFSGIIFVSYKDLSTSYLSQESPRSLLLKTGIKIATDYFPLGSGFGTYSGGINQKFYSPLFYKYRLNNVWGLSESKSSFINDTFWPHVLAETGVIGLILYVLIIFLFFSICFKAIRYLKNRGMIKFAIVSLMLLILSLVESTKATFYEMTLWAFFYFGSIGILQSWLVKVKGNNENPPNQ